MKCSGLCTMHHGKVRNCLVIKEYGSYIAPLCKLDQDIERGRGFIVFPAQTQRNEWLGVLGLLGALAAMVAAYWILAL